MFDRSNLPSPVEAARTEPPGSVGLCFPRASPYQESLEHSPSPPTVGSGELHKGRGGGGAGLSSQEHSIPAAQTSGDPSQGQGPREPLLTPEAPIPSRAGASGALFHNIALYLLSTMVPLDANVKCRRVWVGLGGCGKKVIKALEMILSSSSQLLRASTLWIWTPGFCSCSWAPPPGRRPTTLNKLIPYDLGTILPSWGPCTQRRPGARFWGRCL